MIQALAQVLFKEKEMKEKVEKEMKEEVEIETVEKEMKEEEVEKEMRKEEEDKEDTLNSVGKDRVPPVNPWTRNV